MATNNTRSNAMRVSPRGVNTMAEGQFKTLSESASLTEKHLAHKTASSTQESVQDSSNVFKGESFKAEYKLLPRITHSSSLRTTLSPKRFRGERRVTFLEDYTNVHISDKDLYGQIWTKNQSPSICPSVSDLAPRTLTDITHFQSEMEASINRLLQLTTDLEIATIVPDKSAADYDGCGVFPLWNAFQPNLSEDRPLEVDGYNCTLKPKQCAEDKALKLMALPASVSPQGLMNAPQNIFPSDHNKQISASRLMTHRREEPTETSKVSGLSEGASGSLCGSRPLSPNISELSAVLRGLLDLIDRHWSGNISLHLNPTFVEQALNILTKLKASSQNEMEEKGDVNGSESLKMEGGRIESPDCTEVGHLRRQLAQKTQQLACLQKQLVTARMDNIKLKHQINYLREDNSSWNNIHRQWQSWLQLQGKVLDEEEKHFKGLKASMEILQVTNRSLQGLSPARAEKT